MGKEDCLILLKEKVDQEFERKDKGRFPSGLNRCVKSGGSPIPARGGGREAERRKEQRKRQAGGERGRDS